MGKRGRCARDRTRRSDIADDRPYRADPRLADGSTKLLRERPTTREPVRWVLGQGAPDDCIDIVRDAVVAQGDRGWVVMEVGTQQLRLRAARERWCSRQAVVDDTAEGVLVGAAVDRAALDGLGRQILERPDQALTGLRDRPIHALGEAEIRQPGPLPAAVFEEHVARLDVPVDETPDMGSVERIRDLLGDRRGPGRGQGPLTTKSPREVGPGDEAHGDVVHAARGRGLVRRDDVRVLDGRREARLTKESLLDGRVVGQVMCQDLDRDRPIKALIDGSTHDAHAAPTDDALDPIPGEHRAQSRDPIQAHIRLP